MYDLSKTGVVTIIKLIYKRKIKKGEVVNVTLQSS